MSSFIIPHRELESTELERNQTKEMTTACPYYFGQETTMREPSDTEIKRFNPVFDMMAEEVFTSKLNPS
jgi:hypothetical protein